MVNGRESGSVYVYKVGDLRYLDAKQAAKAYGGNFVWQAVSGKVQLSVRGRQAQLTVDSKRARVVDTGLDLAAPVLVRANTLLVPLQFFSSEEFGRMSWTRTRLDDAAGRLEITARSSVGPLRWFTYKDHTRVVTELDATHVYSLARRGRGALDVTIPLGTVESAQDATIGDGVVESVRLRQEAKLARLSIELAQTAPKAAWDARLFSDPRRLVVDVYPTAEALDRALAGRQARPETVRGDAAPPAPQPTPRKIVIDPGHGGRDSGAVGRRGVLEKDVNLSAAKELARRLREDGSFDVKLTRDADVFVPLADRSRIANDFGADLFISLHCNANRHRSEKGFEIYFLSERASDPEAERVAEMENASLALESGEGGSPDAQAALLLHALARTEFINDASVAAGVMSRALSRHIALPDRGVKQAAFYVLRGTSAPAVLVEMGFLSNSSEESKLDTRKFRSRLVDGIYAGVVDFAKRQEWASASK